MKKNNGFTLVELLAVIVVLGVILVIAGSSLTAVKKNVNKDEAKEIEEMLIDLGPGIYSYEMISGVQDNEKHCKDRHFSAVFDYSSGICTYHSKKLYFRFLYPTYKTLDENESVYISFEMLYSAGYLKEIEKNEKNEIEGIKNPSGGDACTGYLTISKKSDGPEFDACLYCPGLIEDNSDDKKCTSPSGTEVVLTTN